MAKKDIREIAKVEFPEFVEEVNGANVQGLNDRLAGLAKSREGVQDAKDDDEELEDAKEVVKNLAAPYKDAQKVIKLKSRFIIATLKDRGAK